LCYAALCAFHGFDGCGREKRGVENSRSSIDIDARIHQRWHASFFATQPFVKGILDGLVAQMDKEDI